MKPIIELIRKGLSPKLKEITSILTELITPTLVFAAILLKPPRGGKCGFQKSQVFGDLSVRFTVNCEMMCIKCDLTLAFRESVGYFPPAFTKHW